MVAKKIKAMVDDKSPGVDGIPPKQPMETEEQINIPLKLFLKGSRNKLDNYRPDSLTSVICKLLERLIKDHMVDFLVRHKLLNTYQHGFPKARSCLTNMLCF